MHLHSLPNFHFESDCVSLPWHQRISNRSMNNHPVNIGLRFLLELTLVVIFVYWGWHTFEGITRYALSVLLPLTGMGIWGLFRVDGDPGKAPIPVPGWVRLGIEVVLFASACVMLRSLHLTQASWVFLAITLMHYAVSYDRVIRLLKHK